MVCGDLLGGCGDGLVRWFVFDEMIWKNVLN